MGWDIFCVTTWRVIGKSRKLTSFLTIYAGVIVFFVPYVVCSEFHSFLPDYGKAKGGPVFIRHEDIWQHLEEKACSKPHPNLESLKTTLIKAAADIDMDLVHGDGSRRLTYDNIFKNTSYAQLHHKPRPYDVPSLHSFTSNNLDNSHYVLEDSKINELEDYDYREDSGGPLLVGVARDPFRYSIPEKDYLNGVRHMNPQTLAVKNENRGKRGVFHLYNMLYCATGCEPLAYKGYGCYCGFLGSGRPTDGIDRCCKMHDDCYENIYCPFFTVYFQPYYWKCYHGQPLCAMENYQSQHQFINGCAGRLCECDRKFAMCVRQYSCPRSRALCRSSPLRLLQNLLMFR